MNLPLSRPSAFAKPTADKSGTLSPVAGGEGQGEGAIRGSWVAPFRLFACIGTVNQFVLVLVVVLVLEAVPSDRGRGRGRKDGSWRASASAAPACRAEIIPAAQPHAARPALVGGRLDPFLVEND